MRALLACNPASGGGRGARALPGVVERLRRAGVELVEVHRTASLDDARKAACDAATEVDAVVAVGGDGTIGACASGLAAAGPDARAALGVVPAGGGNDLARALGLPTGDPLAAAGLLPGLPRRRVDLATADGRRFLNVAAPASTPRSTGSPTPACAARRRRCATPARCWPSSPWSGRLASP
ncbi:MAG TPA: diacylglycerol kinase family protein [Actinomycetota bacterium]